MNNIQLTQVSNGWIVILPVVHQQSSFSPIEEELIRKQAQIVKDELTSDDFLKQFKEPSDVGQHLVPISEIKENNIHVFKTFGEVLAFLKVTIDA